MIELTRQLEHEYSRFKDIFPLLKLLERNKNNFELKPDGNNPFTQVLRVNEEFYRKYQKTLSSFGFKIRRKNE